MQGRRRKGQGENQDRDGTHSCPPVVGSEWRGVALSLGVPFAAKAVGLLPFSRIGARPGSRSLGTASWMNASEECFEVAFKEYVLTQACSRST
jgi:hypothetical protein